MCGSTRGDGAPQKWALITSNRCDSTSRRAAHRARCRNKLIGQLTAVVEIPLIARRDSYRTGRAHAPSIASASGSPLKDSAPERTSFAARPKTTFLVVEASPRTPFAISYTSAALALFRYAYVYSPRALSCSKAQCRLRGQIRYSLREASRRG